MSVLDLKNKRRTVNIGDDTIDLSYPSRADVLNMENIFTVDEKKDDVSVDDFYKSLVIYCCPELKETYPQEKDLQEQAHFVYAYINDVKPEVIDDMIKMTGSKTLQIIHENMNKILSGAVNAANLMDHASKEEKLNPAETDMFHPSTGN